MPRPGLTPDAITAAGAELVDDIGFAHLSMGVLAERLGVKTPSLYKHVASQADLAHRIAILAMDELADAIRDATQGRAGSDALTAGARTMRGWVLQHPGRYAAGNAAVVSGPDVPLVPAVGRVIASWTAMLHGYDLPAEQRIHALRMLRSLLHGFSVLEAVGSFQLDASVDDSFAWMIAFLDRGLLAAARDTAP